MITVQGTIQRSEFGSGTWVLATEDGQSYELYQPPAELKQVGLKVKIDGEIRTDVMSLAMVGPILTVKRFELD